MSVTIPEIHYMPLSPLNLYATAVSGMNLIGNWPPRPTWLDQMKEAREWLESRRATSKDDWFATA